MTPWSLVVWYQRYGGTWPPLFMVYQYVSLKLWYISARMHGIVTQQTTMWSVHCRENQTFFTVCAWMGIYLAVSEINTRQRDLQSDLKYVYMLLSDFLLSFFLIRTEECGSAGKPCLRLLLFWVLCGIGFYLVTYMCRNVGDQHPRIARASTTPRRKPDINTCLVSGRFLLPIWKGTPVILIEIFRHCRVSLQAIAGVVRWLDHESFLP